MPGYSGTPLFKKLGIKDGIRVSFLGMPTGVRAELKAALSTCEIDRDGKKPINFILYFAKSKAGLDDFDHFLFRRNVAKLLNRLLSALLY